MSNQEIPDFLDNEGFDDLEKKMVETCEKIFETELSNRGLTWQRFGNNQEEGKYFVFFDTAEGVYITGKGNSIKECFKNAINEYDRIMEGKEVPLNPMVKQSDKMIVFKGDPQIDETDNPILKYQIIKERLLNDLNKVTPHEASFFLNYFKDHIDENDFELAAAAQKILGNKNPS